MYHTKDSIVYLNGKFVKASEATCSLYSQTVHYGMGVFEGIRSYHTQHGTRLFKAREHYERLLHSAQLMQIPHSLHIEELIQATYLLLEKNNLEDAYIRPLIYMDENMSLQVKKDSTSNLFIAAWQWDKYLGDKRIHVYISSFMRPSPKAFPVEAKTCGNYVNSILASTEARNAGYDEAILLDQNGFVAEGAASNLFIEKNGKLYTPPRGNILPGVTRGAVMEMAKEKEIEVIEKLFTTDELYAADAAFLTGTAVEIAPIKSVNKIQYKKEYHHTITYELERDFKHFVRNYHDPAYTII
ncbi:branched-chain amino acid transaminase [Rhodocytophaga aerolata]|uniref:Branched-chain-amino-acid aminotransferase n=1 Tax=Rhodocytophaga aerolata TaxID=455078 RepID=A0ABT8R4A6_9BACT|nr:branched-chain amino acid transaminase [Rhodocytophaga aerolata]MDO1446229.1 branched-chain amino acid transaminase [Rhodocytophaga aerolata]